MNQRDNQAQVTLRWRRGTGSVAPRFIAVCAVLGLLSLAVPAAAVYLPVLLMAAAIAATAVLRDGRHEKSALGVNSTYRRRAVGRPFGRQPPQGGLPARYPRVPR